MEELTFTNQKIAIIGMGLLGTSLGMALRKRGFEVVCWARREETRLFALEHHAASGAAPTPQLAVKEADITIFCLPIPVIVNLLDELGGDFKPGSVVTDIGSVKGCIVAAGEAAVKRSRAHFVGSHPMAGTEKSGAEAAFPTLYEHAEVLVTPTENSDPAAVTTVVRLWKELGTSVRLMTPSAHDILVAHTSHVSHLLALGLTLSVLGVEGEALKKLRFSGCATGFKDTSRIASSSPAMWREIVEANQKSVLEAIAEFEACFGKIKELISEGRFDEFEALFAKGKALRDSWIEYKNKEHGCNW